MDCYGECAVEYAAIRRTCHLVGGIPTPLKNDGVRQLG